jgi:peptidoglycan-associated lipoprotein
MFIQNLKRTLPVLLLVVLVACQSSKVPADKKANASADNKPSTSKGLTFEQATTIYFDFNQYSVKETEVEKLEAQATWLLSNKTAKVTVEGHTDYLGTREYNIALGEKRASATKNYLVKKGVDAKNIKVVSYGKDKPVDSADTDEARSKNRRTVSIK